MAKDVMAILASGTPVDVPTLYRKLREWIEKNLPVGRERSLAVTKLEESYLWAMASRAEESVLFVRIEVPVPAKMRTLVYEHGCVRERDGKFLLCNNRQAGWRSAVMPYPSVDAIKQDWLVELGCEQTDEHGPYWPLVDPMAKENPGMVNLVRPRETA